MSDNTDPESSQTGQQQPAAPKPSFIKLVLSTMAAAIGVQSRKNLESDFQQSSPMPFIVAGIVFTVLFVLTLIFVVKVILNNVS